MAAPQLEGERRRTRARFVRVTDSGASRFYGPPGGGFDLDAVAVVSAQRVDAGTRPEGTGWEEFSLVQC